MIAVIFEVVTADGCKAAYLNLAAELAPALKDVDGFISIERFQSLNDARKILSLSFWRDETAIATWRNLERHRNAQKRGRAEIFSDYRLRISTVIRDYGMNDRTETPNDSRHANG